MLAATKHYQRIAAEKQLQRSSKIPQDWLIPSTTFKDDPKLMEVPITCGILNDVECDITSNHDATALLEKLKAGVYSVEQLTIAFCKRAAIAQQLVSETNPTFPIIQPSSKPFLQNRSTV